MIVIVKLFFRIYSSTYRWKLKILYDFYFNPIDPFTFVWIIRCLHLSFQCVYIWLDILSLWGTQIFGFDLVRWTAVAVAIHQGSVEKYHFLYEKSSWVYSTRRWFRFKIVPLHIFMCMLYETSNGYSLDSR